METLTLPLFAKAFQRHSSIYAIIQFGKVTSADGYLVYAAYCGTPIKKIKTITDPAVTSYSNFFRKNYSPKGRNMLRLRIFQKWICKENKGYREIIVTKI